MQVLTELAIDILFFCQIDIKLTMNIFLCRVESSRQMQQPLEPKNWYLLEDK